MLKRIGMYTLGLAFSLCCAYIIWSNETAVYTLKTHGENIALYKNNSVKEIYYTVDTENLPQADIDLLDKGIILENPDDVWIYIEDYDG